MRLFLISVSILVATMSTIAAGKPVPKIGDVLNLESCSVRHAPNMDAGAVGTGGHGSKLGTVIEISAEPTDPKWIKILVTASNDGSKKLEVWEEKDGQASSWYVTIPFEAWVDMPENANHRCYEIDIAAGLDAQQTAEADALTNVKTDHKFRVGALQKNLLLNKVMAQFKAEGYTGARLAAKMKGAKIGINAMAPNSFLVELKSGGKLITTQSGKKQVYDYRIVGQIVEILGKESGEYRNFAKLNRSKTILEILDPVNGTETAIILRK